MHIIDGFRTYSCKNNSELFPIISCRLFVTVYNVAFSWKGDITETYSHVWFFWCVTCFLLSEFSAFYASSQTHTAWFMLKIYKYGVILVHYTYIQRFNWIKVRCLVEIWRTPEFFRAHDAERRGIALFFSLLERGKRVFFIFKDVTQRNSTIE